MPDTIAQPSFDYGSLDTETAQFLNQQASAIKVLVKQSIQNIIEVGKRLLEVKELLAHGQWMNWLDAEFGWTERTALNYMRVAREFKVENISNLQIANTALYLLAQPSTPEEAREEAITRAQSGERISVSSAKDLRDKYVAPKPTPESEPALGLQSDLQPQVAQPEPEVQRPPAPSYPQFSPPPVQTLPRIEPKPTAPSKRMRAREEKPLVIAPKQVQPGEWWKLGDNSYLYCGDPASTEFQKQLPETINLAIAFPPTIHWQLDFFSLKVVSSFALHTAYEEDQDLSQLRQSMEQFLNIYTEGGDIVVQSFLPDPAILPLIEQLECRFICADPDPKRCDAAITVWTVTGGSAERMPSRRGGKKRGASPALA